MRILAAAFAIGVLPMALWACDGVTDGEGLPGRSAEVTFSNAKPGGGRHEGWLGRDQTLVMHAGFDVLTDEYGHRVLGPIRDAKHLAIHLRQPGSDRVTCPKGVVLGAGEVFEDIAPRLADLDGDGRPEIIVVQSNAQKGARLVVYDRRGNEVATTPNIGTRFRWLAPAGIADLDGDGHIELAFVDRPHLARTLRIWRFKDGALTQVGVMPGVTNHRIGEADIAGGVRSCGGAPEMVLATSDWSRLVAVQFDGDGFETRDIGPHRGRQSFKRALAC